MPGNVGGMRTMFALYLAVAVFTIYLRQRGSPESKPVGAPHDQTASSG